MDELYDAAGAAKPSFQELVVNIANGIDNAEAQFADLRKAANVQKKRPKMTTPIESLALLMLGSMTSIDAVSCVAQLKKL